MTKNDELLDAICRANLKDVSRLLTYYLNDVNISVALDYAYEHKAFIKKTIDNKGFSYREFSPREKRILEDGAERLEKIISMLKNASNANRAKKDDTSEQKNSVTKALITPSPMLEDVTKSRTEEQYAKIANLLDEIVVVIKKHLK